MEGHAAELITDMWHNENWWAMDVIRKYPECVTTMVQPPDWKHPLTPVCMAISHANNKILDAIFKIPGASDAPCCDHRGRVMDPLQVCLTDRHDIWVVLNRCRPCIVSLENARKMALEMLAGTYHDPEVEWFDQTWKRIRPSYRPDSEVRRKRLRLYVDLLEKRLESERGIYAILWCFTKVAPGMSCSILEQIYINETITDSL